MSAATILVLCLLGAPDEDRKDKGGIVGGLKQFAPSQPGGQRAQRYDPIPVPKNVDVILKQLLLQTDEDNELAKFLEPLRNNPKLRQVDPNLSKQLQGLLKDPELRSKLLELARNQKNGGLTAEDLPQLQELLKGWTEPPGNMRFPDLRGNDANNPTLDDRLGRMAKDWLKDMDNSRAGDFLRDSPAWRNALRDIDKLTVQAPEGKFDWIRKLPQNVRVPDSWGERLGDWAGKLPNMPKLPRWRISPPNVGRPNVNLGGVPQFGPPSLGGVTMSSSVLWVLVLLFMILLGWLFYRNLGKWTPGLSPARRLGPWPVDPRLVTTRTQLIQAFDYLAILLLGDQARCWNHVEVARHLGEQATRSPAAGALAQLYELARYTPGDDTLPPDAQAAARRHLAFLAGSAAA